MDANKPERTLISIATYNERENIGRLIDEIVREVPSAHVLVVDDASPDGTGKLVDQLAQTDPRVKALHRPGKLGLGSAILDAMRFAIEHHYDYLLNMDADFSHPPRYLPAMLAGMREYDVMIGSRYVPGGGTVDWDWSRKFMSWGINVYSRLLLGLKARDCSGGFRCYRLAKMKLIDFSRVRSRGYSFQEEFLFRCQQVGCRIGETPIIFENRKRGKSNLNMKEAVKSLWMLLYAAIRR